MKCKTFSFTARVTDQWDVPPEDVVCARDFLILEAYMIKIISREGATRASLSPEKMQLGMDKENNTKWQNFKTFPHGHSFPFLQHMHFLPYSAAILQQ